MDEEGDASEQEITMKKIYFWIVLLFFLTSCGPKAEAEAEAIRLRAQAQAASDAQTLQQAQDLHEVEMENTQAAQAQWQAGMNTLIKFGLLSFSISLSLCVLATGIAYSIVAVGKSRAYAMMAVVNETIRINQIPLDRATGQFPLIRHMQGDYIWITNPNNGQVLRLDVRNEPDRQLISAMGATQIMGILAREAAHATSNVDMSTLTIPVTQAKTDALMVGVDIIPFEKK